MRRLLSLWLLAAVGLAGLSWADPPAQPPPPPARIVLVFANPAPGTPPAAGSTTAQYGAGAYGQGQRAHALAQSVARQYALKQVASWPIRSLGVHCVVYEVRAGDDVPALLERLRHDERVALAQALQDFHTLSAGPHSLSSPGDQREGLQEMEVGPAQREPGSTRIAELAKLGKVLSR